MLLGHIIVKLDLVVNEQKIKKLQQIKYNQYKFIHLVIPTSQAFNEAK